jgi:septal ring factor EnvC (AmiA/AmiB activator)
MSVLIDSLSKIKKEPEASAGRDVPIHKPSYAAAQPKKGASPFLAVSLTVLGAILLGAWGWWLFNSLEADISTQQATINTRLSMIDEKLAATHETMKQLVSQDHSTEDALKSVTLAIADANAQLAKLSSEVSEYKKAQDVSAKEAGDRSKEALTKSPKAPAPVSTSETVV